MASAILLSRACLESSLRIPGKANVLERRGGADKMGTGESQCRQT